MEGLSSPETDFQHARSGQPVTGKCHAVGSNKLGGTISLRFSGEGGSLLPSAYRIASAFCVVPLLVLASSAVDNPRALSKKVDQTFAAYDSPKTPGCALGVIRDGEFIVKRAYGAASLATSRNSAPNWIRIPGYHAVRDRPATPPRGISPTGKVENCRRQMDFPGKPRRPAMVLWRPPSVRPGRPLAPRLVPSRSRQALPRTCS